METTFITIHDVSPEAHILYCSDSVVDILGHTPDEVLYKSGWDFFHPEELAAARSVHSESIKLDKAAVLAYCRLLGSDGTWVGCECCFSICYDVLVVCTSIYYPSMASQRRAVEAPIVRRLFAASPKDPRYNMLAHLSSKFRQTIHMQIPEPRAALFLNRFTRTLTIMYATSGIEQILGIPSEDMTGRSFYYCIARNCLESAVNCLESAKGNDSIAYLRFWFRDPRQDDAAPPESSSDSADTDASMTDGALSEDDDQDMDGGVQLSLAENTPMSAEGTNSRQSRAESSQDEATRMDVDNGQHATLAHEKSGSSGDSLNPDNTPGAIFGSHISSRTSVSSAPSTRQSDTTLSSNRTLELEAVVSCTSDGLVVCLRKARPLVPPTLEENHPTAAAAAAATRYPNGLFAAPWASEPVFITPPPQQQQQQHQHEGPRSRHLPDRLVPPTAAATPPAIVTTEMDAQSPAHTDLMASIREIAAFAWALTGINGSLADYSRGRPTGNAVPPNDAELLSPTMSSRRRKRTSSSGSSSAVRGERALAVNGEREGREGSSSSAQAQAQANSGGWPFGDPGLSRR